MKNEHSLSMTSISRPLASLARGRRDAERKVAKGFFLLT